MTDIKLLPLPEPMRVLGTRGKDAAEAWCRANAAHATAPLQAEIEALRAERDSFQRVGIAAQARAERLAEALWGLVVNMEWAQANMRHATKIDPRWEGCAEAIQPRVDAARAALRDQESCVDAAIKEVLDNERNDEAFEYAQFIANEIRKRLVR